MVAQLFLGVFQAVPRPVVRSSRGLNDERRDSPPGPRRSGSVLFDGRTFGKRARTRCRRDRHRQAGTGVGSITSSAAIGSSRIRRPVALKTAFAIAAATPT